MANFNDGLFGSFAIARLVGLSLERLRYCESLGIVRPNRVQCGTRRFKRYSQQDINRAQAVKRLVDEERYSLGGAIVKLKESENCSLKNGGA